MAVWVVEVAAVALKGSKSILTTIGSTFREEYFPLIKTGTLTAYIKWSLLMTIYKGGRRGRLCKSINIDNTLRTKPITALL